MKKTDLVGFEPTFKAPEALVISKLHYRSIGGPRLRPACAAP